MTTNTMPPRAGRATVRMFPASPVPHAHFAEVRSARLADQRRYFVAAAREAQALAEVRRLRALLAAHGIDAEAAPCA